MFWTGTTYIQSGVNNDGSEFTILHNPFLQRRLENTVISSVT